jgi:hypothetical protein
MVEVKFRCHVRLLHALLYVIEAILHTTKITENTAYIQLRGFFIVPPPVINGAVALNSGATLYSDKTEDPLMTDALQSHV